MATQTIINFTEQKLVKVIEEIRALEELQKEVKAKISDLETILKEYLADNNTESMQIGTYMVRNTSVLSQRFDTTRFKKELESVYNSYLKQVQSTKFSIK